MRQNPPVIILIFLLLFALAPAASSQRVEGVTVRLDNDILALRGTGAPPDYDYTHGLTVAAGLAGAPGWGRLLAPGLAACAPDRAESGPCVTTRIEVGQRIYTPRQDAPTPVPGERPYAAWLYASAGGAVVGEHRRRSFAVEVGITGPPALGEPVQNGVHRLLGSERQVGWEHQIPFEPGVTVRYDEALRFGRRLARLGTATVEPAAGLAAGTVLTGVHAGVRLRVGREDGGGWIGEIGGAGRGPYLLAGARGEWVLRNVFLDGATFGGGEEPEVRKEPLVGEGEIGFGWGFRRWSVDYRHVVRTREYRTQPDPHGYGSITVVFFPRR